MCNKCGGVGFSWYYYCEFCKVHMHVDCLDDTDEAEEGALTEVHEKFMLEYGSSDDHTRMDMVIKMLDILLVNDTSKPSTASESIRASSSSSLPSEEVATKARPKTQTGIFSSNRLDDVNLRKKIAADVVQRKAKRKEGKIKRKRERQISKANLFEMLGSLEKSIIDLQSFKSRSQVEAKILETALEKIKKRQHFLFHEMTTIKSAPPNMHRGPQLCLFYLEKNNIKTVLNSLEANMETVHMLLLCEEPGQEHIVPQCARNAILLCDGVLGERSEKLEPLLSAGLQVVMRAMSTLVSELPTLEHVTLPILGGEEYNMNTLQYDIVKHGLRKPFIGNVGSHNRVANFARHSFSRPGGAIMLDNEEDEKTKLQKEATEWLLNYLEDNRLDILKRFGLSPICYTETEKSDVPRYTQGSVAWLCNDHVINGVKAGRVEK
ncbi:hypothetical protein KC19_6G016000 [Ceratodon purpureus]|uniref:DC1 domain-containing protein n=1 Tax=Ceratodon purpureus TaxID=3225 RepID=A0A8T0HAS8_CERPU|nr:hypothetical protein KC19_6G016000 [Ceratodon purpureus]